MTSIPQTDGLITAVPFDFERAPQPTFVDIAAAQELLTETDRVARREALKSATEDVERLLEPNADLSAYYTDPQTVLWTINDAEEQLNRAAYLTRRVGTVNTASELAANGIERSHVTYLFPMEQIDDEHQMAFVIGTFTKRRTFGIIDTAVGALTALTPTEIVRDYGEDMILKIGRALNTPDESIFD